LTIEKIAVLVPAVTIIAVFFLAFFLSVRITMPIVNVAVTLKDMSEGEGDLTKTVAVHS
jgi:methyl-accepting chemotaxis protein